MDSDPQNKFRKNLNSGALRGAMAFLLPPLFVFLFGIFIHLGETTEWIQATGYIWPTAFLLLGMYFTAPQRKRRVWSSVVIAAFGTLYLPVSAGIPFLLQNDPRLSYEIYQDVFLSGLQIASLFTFLVVAIIWIVSRRQKHEYRNALAVVGATTVALAFLLPVLPLVVNKVFPPYLAYYRQASVHIAWSVRTAPLDSFRYDFYVVSTLILAFLTCSLIVRTPKERAYYAVVAVVAASASAIALLCILTPHLPWVASYRLELVCVAWVILGIWTLTGALVGAFLSLVSENVEPPEPAKGTESNVS
jgi:hypothetical protein